MEERLSREKGSKKSDEKRGKVVIDHVKSENKLGRAVLLHCIVIAILISTCGGALGFAVYYRSGVKYDQNIIRMFLDLSSEELDGDELQRCIDNRTKTEEFDRMQQCLNDSKNSGDFEYIYAVLPLNTKQKDNMMYVLTGVSDEERKIFKDVISLGDMSDSEYSPEVAQFYLDQMKLTNGEITYFRNRTEFGYMYTGMKTITSSDGNAVCVIAVDISMDDIFGFMKRFLLYLSLCCVGMTFLFLWVRLAWMKKRVTGPIHELEEAAILLKESMAVASHPEELTFEKPETPADDEIRSLANAIESMAIAMRDDMARLQNEIKAKERVTSELRLAREIQEFSLQLFVPQLPERPEIDFFAETDRSGDASTDFYDCFFVDSDHLVLVMADVEEEGLPATLYMLIAKALFKNRARDGLSPKEIFESVNNMLCRNNRTEMFVSAWLGMLELSTGKLLSVNAGHERPMICRAGGKFELIKETCGLVLADLEDEEYLEHELQMNPGDCLYLYSDGISDAVNMENNPYGTDRMLKALNRNSNLEPKDLLGAVTSDLSRFVDQAPQMDDRTMMAVKLHHLTAPENDRK